MEKLKWNQSKGFFDEASWAPAVEYLVPAGNISSWFTKTSQISASTSKGPVTSHVVGRGYWDDARLCMES